MIAVLLMLLVGGIALSQAVSNPRQVTLRWLRLGGLINIALLAVAGTMTALADIAAGMTFWGNFVLTTVVGIAQLMTTQTAKRTIQRAAAVACYLLAVETAVTLLAPTVTWPASINMLITGLNGAAIVLSTLLAAGLLGGFLMTMLLGHAYLTAGGEMTQRPFVRLVLLLAVLMALRAALSGAMGAWPYLHQPTDQPQTWNMMMITARYLVGIFVPSIFLYMIYDCVKRRANQSATGILYVAGVLVIIGEGISLTLMQSTGLAF